MNPLVAAGGFAAFSAASDIWGSFVSPRWTPSKYKSETQAWKMDPCKYLELSDADWLYKIGYLTRVQMNHTIGSNGYNFGDLLPNQLRMFYLADDNKIRLKLDNINPRDGHYPYDRLRILKKDFFTTDDLFTLVNRGMMPEDTAAWILGTKYQGEFEVARKVMELRYEIPPYSDLIHFAVKEAFNKEVIEAMGYNKELPAEIVPWMRKLGYGGKTGFAMPAGSTTTLGRETRTECEWLDHIWYSHWQNMSPSQWYSSLHRFYRNSPHGASPEVSDENATTIEDVERGLKVDDYPIPLRNRLISLSYSPLTRVDARRMYDMDVLDEDDLYHTYRAIGYDDRNAERLMQWNKKQKQQRQHGSTRKRAERAIEKLVTLGAMDLNTFQQRMIDLGYPRNQVQARWDLIHSEMAAKKLERLTNKVRKWYLNGSLNTDQAKTILTSNGISQDDADSEIALLDQDKHFGRKFLSAREAIEVWQNRLQNEQQTYNRLINLGYTQAEATLIMSNAKVNMTTKAQRALIAEQKKQAMEQARELRQKNEMYEKNQRAKSSYVKDQQRIKQRRLDKALAAFSEKNMVKWVKGGVIDIETIESVLFLKGWTPNAVRAFMISHLGQTDYELPERVNYAVPPLSEGQGNGKAMLEDSGS